MTDNPGKSLSNYNSSGNHFVPFKSGRIRFDDVMRSMTIRIHTSDVVYKIAFSNEDEFTSPLYIIPQSISEMTDPPEEHPITSNFTRFQPEQFHDSTTLPMLEIPDADCPPQLQPLQIE
jgi:hypothetical protein